MCDTIVATPEATADGITLLAKNSDREPNEAQLLVQIPARDYPPGSRLKCTYLDIPQVEHTYAVLLSKPFWMWGAEMGVNEHGVAIGNEAVFTRLPVVKEPTLLGMDLLRLGLERSTSARQAVTVITSLMEQYNQGGNGGFTHPLYYHNSYLIADPRQAWVLETADRQWAARQVHGVYTISNRLTITNQWDLASPNLVSTAIQRGWCKSPLDFDFARCYSDVIYSTFSDARSRRACTLESAQAVQGHITVRDLMGILRGHGVVDPEVYRPDRGLAGAQVCAHASFGPIRGSQTTGSLVAHLHLDHPTYFFTAAAAPCTGVFKPVWLDAGLPDLGPLPTGNYDPTTLYWKHEELHRASLRDLPTCLDSYQSARTALEQKFIEQAFKLAVNPINERAQFSQQCFQEAGQAEQEWLARVKSVRPARRNPLHRLAWQRFNRAAKMPD
jgi:secernin